MSIQKKNLKSKFVSEDISDFLNDSEFLKEEPKTKKAQKRQRTEVVDGISSFNGQRPTGGKNKKSENQVDSCGESRRKLFDVISRQMESRKQTSDTLLKSLSDVLSSMEADHNALKDNEQKLEHLTGAFMKCIQQGTLAHKQKLKALKEIHASFQREAEGLLKRGAIKPDERPLWFDVYKAFPPITEPKFARPKVQDTTIRPILYKEDVVRAKFHASGHGLGINMLISPSGETQIKKLMQQYEKLKSENVPENELIDKAASIISNERQQQAQNIIPKSPESATSQVLSEANIQNIFKE